MTVIITDTAHVNNLDILANLDDDVSVIGIQNIANESNIQNVNANQSTPEYFATLANTSERWIVKNQQARIFNVEENTPFDFDYVGIAAHKGLIGCRIQIVALINNVEVLREEKIVTNNDTLMFIFSEKITCDSMSVIFIRPDFTAFDSEIGLINVGNLVKLPRKIYVDHTPLQYGRVPDSRSIESDNGQYLGQLKRAVSLESNVNLDYIDPRYYRNELFQKFQIPAENNPFFWAWRPKSYPNEVGLAWIPNGRVNVRNSSPNGTMSINFNMRGYVDNG